ncbi:MAG TPA: di-trans,poly-cis-decaprenylcistransferase [Thermoprotei archaeon]|nr:di-trans,poly-cis-decaprenylcistransferase [Thermoprotei archaeon]
MLRIIVELTGIYKIYEKWIWHQIKGGKKPSHIAIILDGNRRWARKKGLPPWMGHKEGAEKVKRTLRWLLDSGVRTVTLYVLSTENLKRNRVELEKLFDIFREYLRDALNDTIFDKYKIRFKAIGDLSLVPEDIRLLIKKMEERTQEYNKFYLNIAIAYGGRIEIIKAVKKIAKKVAEGSLNIDDINEKLFEKYLFTSHLPNPSPDIIIRTSGEERLSNFLLWQSAYSELCFLDVFWPDFRKIDLWRAIRIYQKRKRRFGR